VVRSQPTEHQVANSTQPPCSYCREKGLSQFIPSPDSTHVGAAGTGPAFFLYYHILTYSHVNISTFFVPRLPREIELNLLQWKATSGITDKRFGELLKLKKDDDSER